MNIIRLWRVTGGYDPFILPYLTLLFLVVIVCFSLKGKKIKIKNSLGSRTGGRRGREKVGSGSSFIILVLLEFVLICFMFCFFFLFIRIN